MGSILTKLQKLCMSRIDILKKWVTEDRGKTFIQWTDLVADASVRRYYRVNFQDASYVVMDSPVDLVPVEPFVRIAKLLQAHAFWVPDIFAVEAQEGFVLLSDLGDLSYQKAIEQQDPFPLYHDALDVLIKIASVKTDDLPLYDQAFLQRELQIFEEWYVNQYLKTPLNDDKQQQWKDAQSLLIAKILQQPTIFMHRDFHCRNLMWQEGRIGILDFQDAVKGPIGYDLISLLKDAYVDLPETFVLDLMIRFWEKAKKADLPVPADFAEFYQAVEWIGLQRHLKILGIFARLYLRDGNDRYLADIPRVLNYIYKVTERYSELHSLHKLLKQIHETETSYDYTF